MSKALMQLFVVISCPADLATERQVVEAAVAETNTVLTKTHGVVLTAISWEKDLLPGIGPDAQSVINSQIEGRYDIYIGLLGARFGSETPRAGSGTEEEFNQAYKRYAAAPETVRVLFYFKNTADNVHRLDLEQLAKVIKFRKKLSATALSYEFTTPDVLLKMIKDHLFRLVAEQWDGRNWKVLTPLPQATQANQKYVRGVRGGGTKRGERGGRTNISHSRCHSFRRSRVANSHRVSQQDGRVDERTYK